MLLTRNSNKHLPQKRIPTFHTKPTQKYNTDNPRYQITINAMPFETRYSYCLFYSDRLNQYLSAPMSLQKVYQLEFKSLPDRFSVAW